MEEELLGGTRAKPKTGRPVRSIMYYMKVGVIMMVIYTLHMLAAARPTRAPSP